MKKFITLPILTAIFLACAFFPQPLWAAVITIGETNILTGNDSRKRNLLIATPVSLSQTATMQSLSFYVSTPAGQLRLGIYDATGPNGAPGAKKTEINEITPVAGWNTAHHLTVQLSQCGRHECIPDVLIAGLSELFQDDEVADGRGVENQ